MTEHLPDAVLRYADHEDGIVDVHLPRSAGTGDPADPAARVVVLIHGGFWKTAYDRRHTRPMARALAAAGFVVASPEYRRVGPGGQGGWPVTAQDVRRAVERLPELLEGIGVRSGATLVTGHSAGGHLALWLATAGLPIERTVALAPACDLRRTAALSLGGGAVAALMGGGPDEVDYDPADPMVRFEDVARSDVAIVHGTLDDSVPVELSRGFVARHPWVRLTELPVGHFELIDPADAAFGTVLEALLEPVTRPTTG